MRYTTILTAVLAVMGHGLASSRSLADSGASHSGGGMGLSDEISSTLFALVEFAEEARPHIHREEFELQARLDKLDYDATQILQFVSEGIGFEPYPGLLRGATGTLMSRGGNSIDQAVLLATLLRDAGFMPASRTGELQPEDARRLVAMLIRPSQAADPWNEDGMRQAQNRFSTEVTSPAAAAAKRAAGWNPRLLSTKPWTERDFIVRKLKDSGVHLGGPDGLDQIVEEAGGDDPPGRRQTWPSEPWQRAHPAFGRRVHPDLRPSVPSTAKFPRT